MKRISIFIALIVAGAVFMSFAQELKPGLRNIKIGMTKDQVEKAMAEDEMFVKGADTKVTGVTIGDYVPKPAFEYTKDGLLYSITLTFDPVPDYSIPTIIQAETSYFYDVFSKKYGKPAYTKWKDFTDKLGVVDFKENELSHVYYWVNNDVRRTVSLAMDKTNYFMVITITDIILKGKAVKEEKKEDKGKKKVEDF